MPTVMAKAPKIAFKSIGVKVYIEAFAVPLSPPEKNATN